jgi:hypothetical protein
VTKAKEVKMEKAIYIPTTGEVEVREFVKKDSYEFLRSSVEGWIECVHLASIGVDMWLNEEGKIYNLPTNEFGTVLFFREFNFLDRICGNIVITSSNKNGDTVGLTAKQIEQLTELLGYDLGELQTA